MNTRPNRRRFIKIAAIQSLSLLGAKSLIARSKKNTIHTWQGILFGADANLQIVHSRPETASRILKRCVTELRRLESIFTLYDSQSQLSQLNRTGQLQAPVPEFQMLLSQAIEYGAKTFGTFDITVHPVVEALRHGASQTKLEAVRNLVDYRQIVIRDQEISLSKPGAAVTLNGIAQGFVTDRISELLKAEGIESTLVELGEKRAIGSHPENRPWQIGLADPENPSAFTDIAELSDKALSSSGGYGTQFEGSPGAHHLVNPFTGQSSHTFKAVHVIADTATEADALSTALSCCSLEQFQKIRDAFPKAKVITVPAS